MEIGVSIEMWRKGDNLWFFGFIGIKQIERIDWSGLHSSRIQFLSIRWLKQSD